jgi:hypothetical protein
MLNEVHCSCLKPWFNVPLQDSTDSLRGGKDQLIHLGVARTNWSRMLFLLFMRMMQLPARRML